MGEPQAVVAPEQADLEREAGRVVWSPQGHREGGSTCLPTMEKSEAGGTVDSVPPSDLPIDAWQVSVSLSERKPSN